MSKILVVDDNLHSQFIISALLANEGYDLIFAENGEKALGALAKQVPDLMLLDVLMPDINGYELCEIIRKNPLYSELPIIFVTSLEDSESRLRGLKAGGDDFISKPIDRSELKLRINTITRLIRHQKIINERKNFQSIVELSSEAIFVIEQYGKILTCNNCARMILEENDTNAIISEDFYRFLGLSKGNLLRELDKILNLKHPKIALESFIVTSGKKLVPVEIFMTPCQWNQKDAIHVVLRDLNDKKKLEEQKKQLKKADKMILQIVHEINNPNNYIRLNNQVIAKILHDTIPILESVYQDKGSFNVGGFDYIEMPSIVDSLLTGINEGSERIRILSEELKNYIREEDDSILYPFDFNEVVQKAVKISASLIEKSTNNFTLSLMADLPKIQGSPIKVEQAVANLIQNSCQALTNKDEEIALRTSFNARENSVICEIIDQGIGIAKEKLPFITEPFFTTKKKRGGIGLGLAISLDIIKKHKGQLKFEINKFRGLTARIELPAFAAELRSLNLDCEGSNNNHCRILN